jgi:hypothetical protein
MLQSPATFLKICNLLCQCKGRLITEIEAVKYLNDNLLLKSVIGPYLGLEVTKTSLFLFQHAAQPWEHDDLSNARSSVRSLDFVFEKEKRAFPPRRPSSSR